MAIPISSGNTRQATNVANPGMRSLSVMKIFLES